MSLIWLKMVKYPHRRFVVMELEQIVENMAISLKVVDESTEIQRESRSGSGAYIPCVGTMWEDDFTRESVITWALRAPGDFQNFTRNGRGSISHR